MHNTKGDVALTNLAEKQTISVILCSTKIKFLRLSTASVSS